VMEESESKNGSPPGLAERIRENICPTSPSRSADSEGSGTGAYMY
jgi:hypothetical protein